MSDIIERLKKAAEDFEAMRAYSANDINSDCEPHYSDQIDMAEASKAAIDAAAEIERLRAALSAPPETRERPALVRQSASLVPDNVQGEPQIGSLDPTSRPPETPLQGWTKVTPDMPFEVLKSITKDNQVLAFERGRYFNAWLTFDEYEGGWCWVDDSDSEPSPSHYRPLIEVALATEGQDNG